MAEADAIANLSRNLVDALNARRLSVASAESCTGGWIAKSITDVPGSSGCFGYGLVSYSNAAKQALLGVPSDTLERCGAVSEETVVAMAQGALAESGADLSVAVSGIAGPGGGTPEKPVGTVWFAWAGQAANGPPVEARRENLQGDRDAVRAQTVAIALAGLLERLP